MKKLLLIASALFVFSVANAQEAVKAEGKQPTKEEKQKMKEKQEADMAAAFKEIGLTDEQIEKVKAVSAEASKKNGEVRKNESLSDDQKQEQIKANNDEKNQKIKEIMGEDKYRQFNAIRKKQKEAAADMSAPKPAGN